MHTCKYSPYWQMFCNTLQTSSAQDMHLQETPWDQVWRRTGVTEQLAIVSSFSVALSLLPLAADHAPAPPSPCSEELPLACTWASSSFLLHCSRSRRACSSWHSWWLLRYTSFWHLSSATCTGVGRGGEGVGREETGVGEGREMGGDGVEGM